MILIDPIFMASVKALNTIEKEGTNAHERIMKSHSRKKVTCMSFSRAFAQTDEHNHVM